MQERAIRLSLALIDVAAELGAFPRPRNPERREAEAAGVREKWIELHRRSRTGG